LILDTALKDAMAGASKIEPAAASRLSILECFLGQRGHGVIGVPLDVLARGQDHHAGCKGHHDK
jgi:hypothetical protein